MAAQMASDDARRGVSARPRWRWILQGAVIGALAATLLALTIDRLRGDVEPIETPYSAVTPQDFGDHRMTALRVWDVRQPSSVPRLASLGGERHISMSASLELVQDSAERIDLEEMDVTLYAVDESTREALTPTPDSGRTLDGLAGTLGEGDPFWLRLTYQPPKSSADSYELVLVIDGEEHTLQIPEEET